MPKVYYLLMGLAACATLNSCSCGLCNGIGWVIPTKEGNIAATTKNIRKHGRHFMGCMRCNPDAPDTRVMCGTCKGTGRDSSRTQEVPRACPKSEESWVSRWTHDIYFDGVNPRYTRHLRIGFVNESERVPVYSSF